MRIRNTLLPLCLAAYLLALQGDIKQAPAAQIYATYAAAATVEPTAQSQPRKPRKTYRYKPRERIEGAVYLDRYGNARNWGEPNERLGAEDVAYIQSRVPGTADNAKIPESLRFVSDFNGGRPEIGLQYRTPDGWVMKVLDGDTMESLLFKSDKSDEHGNARRGYRKIGSNLEETYIDIENGCLAVTAYEFNPAESRFEQVSKRCVS